MTLYSIDEFLETIVFSEVPVQSFSLNLRQPINNSLYLARFDQVDPYISGNKAFKLLPYFKAAIAKKKSTLLSFGGLYSNHLHSLAIAGQRLGFKTVGVVRSFDNQPESITLEEMRKAGMHIAKVTPAIYRTKHTPAFLAEIKDEWPDACIIPEGGGSQEGLEGAAMMASQLVKNLSCRPDYLIMPVGTGTTLAGFLHASQHLDALKDTTFIGIAAVNDIARMKQSCLKAIDTGSQVDWTIMDGYCLGGFAKINPTLSRFMLDFEARNKVLLDPVYTAKMLYAVDDLIRQGYFEPGASIVCLHTGGVQGRRGLIDKIKRRARDMN